MSTNDVSTKDGKLKMLGISVREDQKAYLAYAAAQQTMRAGTPKSMSDVVRQALDEYMKNHPFDMPDFENK